MFSRPTWCITPSDGRKAWDSTGIGHVDKSGGLPCSVLDEEKTARELFQIHETPVFQRSYDHTCLRGTYHQPGHKYNKLGMAKCRVCELDLVRTGVRGTRIAHRTLEISSLSYSIGEWPPCGHIFQVFPRCRVGSSLGRSNRRHREVASRAVVYRSICLDVGGHRSYT